jgi:hypothetical protein
MVNDSPWQRHSDIFVLLIVGVSIANPDGISIKPNQDACQAIRACLLPGISGLPGPACTLDGSIAISGSKFWQSAVLYMGRAACYGQPEKRPIFEMSFGPSIPALTAIPEIGIDPVKHRIL